MPLTWTRPLQLKLDITLGYAYFIDRTHPLAHPDTGRVYYHRHVASIKIGRWVTSNEHVHHIDRNKLNNEESNLEVLTASQHALKHSEGEPRVAIPCTRCGTPTFNRQFCSSECHHFTRRKVSRPTAAKLAEEMKCMPMVVIGKKYGVSDNAVRKWARSYGLL